ncbi:sigma-54 dependent transcriptional regulator [Myxococcota bacterium]|nr:sigma-54 dependent transcriptional regulator [Myxococcota bacterium]
MTAPAADAPTILVIDDKDSARALVRRILEPAGYRVLEAPGVVEAQDVQSREHLDMVLSDLRMNDIDGIEGMSRLRAVDPELPVIIITAYASVDTALEAMKTGAFDYLSKPIEPEALKYSVERAIAHRRLVDENKKLREKLSGTRQESRFIARAKVMVDLLRLVERVAPTDLPVLIEGDSGAGKELIARRVHALSKRAHKRFLSINCSAIPETLLESELFGYEKAAFSGATTARPGFFAEADGGTLMLDEIGDMSLGLQPKLLRVLQEGEYYPLGERAPRRCDVRIICATNRDLVHMVEEGTFREDLYYRIDRARLRIPPLRERPEDIAPLAEYYLEQSKDRFATEATRISPDAMRALLAYKWRGNVRELAAVIERSCLAARGPVIEVDDLPPEITATPSAVDHGASAGSSEPPSLESLDYRAAREAFEARYLAQLMEAAEGNVAKAAKIANIHRATLYEKLTRHGIATK